MAAKLTRLTHKITIQLHLVAECNIIFSSPSRWPVRKLLDAPSYAGTMKLHGGRKREINSTVNRLDAWADSHSDTKQYARTNRFSQSGVYLYHDDTADRRDKGHSLQQTPFWLIDIAPNTAALTTHRAYNFTYLLTPDL
jgi:hypothetical protein